MNTKNVSDFLNTEVKEYSVDVIENRAIPSVIDGLKPTARKVVYIADKIWKTGNEKPMKVFQFVGKMAADAYYHHGDASANQVVTGMGQTFKNSLPLLDGIGQYGTLRSPEAGAPRYISGIYTRTSSYSKTRLTKVWSLNQTSSFLSFLLSY